MTAALTDLTLKAARHLAESLILPYHQVRQLADGSVSWQSARHRRLDSLAAEERCE